MQEHWSGGGGGGGGVMGRSWQWRCGNIGALIFVEVLEHLKGENRRNKEQSMMVYLCVK